MDGILFIDCFSSYCDELLQKNEIDSHCLSKIKNIQSYTEFITNFLKDVIERKKYRHKEQKDLILQCVNAVYESELLVEAFVVEKFTGRTFHWFNDVIQNLRHIETKVTKIYDSHTYEGTTIYDLKANEKGLCDATTVSSSLSAQTSSLTINEVQIQNEVHVGFEDEEKTILELLIKDLPKELDVISIIGMPGLGKTTLAKKVFHHETIAYKFDVCLICCVSQVYKKRELLLDMLRQLDKLPENVYEMTDEDLADIFRKSLLGKRYLIMVDDVWNTDTWDDLTKPFPMQNTGSRILLTSRYEKVASYAKRVSDPHYLRSFTREESWKLMQKIVFRNESCPLELLEVGKRIAENCRGLPLVTVLISGVLANVKRSPFSWNKIAKRFDLQTKDVRDQCMSTIELSYKNLPEHLKPCFLYLAAFPEDEEISVRRLLQLWIAERFIPITGHETLAEDYLMDLISRSLVIIAKRRSTGGVKAILVHDLIRDFCLAKAEGNFLQWLHRVNPSRSHPLNSYNGRLCTYSSDLFTNEGIISSRIRSLLVQNAYSYSRNIFHRFKYLRVLDVGCIIGEDSLNSVYSLIHLRYLALRIKATKIHRSILKLHYLQTFIVYGCRGDVHIPDEIWQLVHLRHIHIDPLPSFGSNEPPCIDSELDNLQSFSTPVLRWDRMDIVRKMVNLRKLKYRFSHFWGYSSKSDMKCTRFPELEFLSKLESLKVIGNNVRLPCEFNLPVNLKKLTLSCFYLPWSEMSTIAMLLPNLEVLKLLSGAFDGKRWEMKDEKFSKLKILKLEKLDLEHWSANDEAFPKLEQLVLKKCGKLEKIPSRFGEIYTLQIVEVHECSRSVERSALEIKEQQLEEMGIEGLKLVLSHLTEVEG